MTTPLLSICIPTYNRAKYLHSNLLSIFSQIKRPELIEVIVGDNNSTDETHIIIQTFYKYSNFTFFKHEENIGPANNFVSVVSRAKGEYCWIIGDDDFILQGRIEKIINLIQLNRNINFFYVKVVDFPLEMYNQYQQPFQTESYKYENPNVLDIIHVEKWENLLSPKYSIIFMGEVMAGIFKKSIWDSYRIYPEKNMFASLESIYPHCVIYANTLFGQKAIYIKTPIILALSGNREWWDRQGYILIVYIRKLLDLYKKSGLNGCLLMKCNVSYIKITLKFALKYLILQRNSSTNKVSLITYYGFLFKHPISTFVAFCFFVKLLIQKLVTR